MKSYAIRIILGVLALAGGGAAAQPAPMADVAREQARAFFGDSCHVGLSIAAVDGSRTTFYNFGASRRGRGTPPTPNSLYEIASVTKSFTGALAAQAVSDGRMTLDGDFRAYLPGTYPNLARDGAAITLRNLATHRSGLPRDLPDSDALFSRRDFRTLPYDLLRLERGYDRRRYLADLHGVQLRSKPGTKEVYSNLGMKVIGFGLETVDHKPFETLMRDGILKPLHMRDTGFAVTAAARHRLVTGYDRFGRVMPYHLRNAGAAWGLYSTPADLAKYVRWQLDESRPAIKLAHSVLAGTETDGQGLIWNIAATDGQRQLWHGGGSFGMTSQVVLYPDSGDGYVLLANDSCPGTEDALKSMAQRLHDAGPHATAAVRPNNQAAF